MNIPVVPVAGGAGDPAVVAALEAGGVATQIHEVNIKEK